MKDELKFQEETETKYKSKNKMIIATFIAAIVLLATVYIQPAFAYENNNVAFHFPIASYYGNGQEGVGRYRSTESPQNTWKVKMTDSSERPVADKTMSKFWLEKSTGTNVTYTWTVLEDDDPLYATTFTSGCQTWVWLTGENNNFNGNTYNVEGYWDEETGVAL